MGLSLPRPVVHMAEAAPRHARIRAEARHVRHLPTEPRSGRELSPRPALPYADQSWPVQGDDGLNAAWSWNAHAVARAGVRCLKSLFLLCRPPAGIGQA